MTYQKSVLDTSDFLQGYQSYLKIVDISKLTDFLDDIEVNKKYYKMTINKNQRYKKDVIKDTECLKEITSLINKITDKTYTKIENDITKLVKDDHIKPFLIDVICEQSLSHHIYIPYYVRLLKTWNSQRLVQKHCDKFYRKLFVETTDNSSESSYQKLCSKNKKIDNIIGFSLFIANLEKENIITNYIQRVLEPFMEKLNVLDDETELYKMLTSFYNIAKLKYSGEIPNEYINILMNLKQKTKSSKIRFYIMDILDE